MKVLIFWRLEKILITSFTTIFREPDPNVFADEEQLMGVKPKEGTKTVLELSGFDDISKHDVCTSPFNT